MRREGDQGEVAGVQHQLEAEQDHQRAAADEHAARRRSRRAAPRGRGTRRCPSRTRASPDISSASRPGMSGLQQDGVGLVLLLRPARTTAPTAATSSSIEAASKATRKRSSSSLPIAAGEPKPGLDRRALGVERSQRGAEDRDRELDEEGGGEQRGEEALAGDRLPERLLDAADVGDDEDVEDHHRAGVDDDLGGGDELGVQQQEERRRARPGGRSAPARCRRGCAGRSTPIAPAEGADRAGEEADDLDFHRSGSLAHSPSRRSGVRSIGSASSISLVKIRSSRL